MNVCLVNYSSEQMHYVKPFSSDQYLRFIKRTGRGMMIRTRSLCLQFCFAVLMIFLMHGTVLAESAFHSGGGGDCEGCHNIHSSNTGDIGISQSEGNIYLLKGSDQSSTCLNCHQNNDSTDHSDYYVSTAEADMPAGSPPAQLTPAGDFGWLKKSYSWDPASASMAGNSPGERHGHNIVAGDYGYMQDSIHPVAPGGSYPSASLHCTSCHDPHGKYRRNNDGTITTTGKPIIGSGSYSNSAEPDDNYAVGVYRLLGGIGYTPKSLSAYAFVNGPPAAVAPDMYNRTETMTQTRVAYGGDMSEWCMNCHLSFDSGGAGSSHLHPAGNSAKLGTEISINYNSYINTGNLTGTAANSYLSLIPFEEGLDDHTLTTYSQLRAHARNDDSFLEGPHNNNENVSCISCHRAHASGWDGIGRYNFKSTFITVSDASGAASYPDTVINPESAMGRTSVETRKAYYDRPASTFGIYQRALCNKCHAKD
jgi:hypothetical protein